jgi:hypothetical protein
MALCEPEEPHLKESFMSDLPLLTPDRTAEREVGGARSL